MTNLSKTSNITTISKISNKPLFKKIYIEITNVCNLDCDFCPKTKRKPEFMQLDLFKKAINEKLSDEITLHIMGEPLLHPKIEEFINLAEQKNIKINLTTNGTIIKNFLLNKTIRRINFSIHGIIANFPTEEQKKQKKQKEQKEQISYLKDIINFTKLAQKEREDLVIIYRLWNTGKNIDNKNNYTDNNSSTILKLIEKEFNIKLKDQTTSVKIKNNAFIHFDNSFEWPAPTNPIRTKKGYCHGLSTHIGILSDGTVVPCCLDNDGNIPLGNIKDNTLKEILLLPRAVNMKKGFQERKLIEDLCQRCTYIKRFEKSRDK